MRQQLEGNERHGTLNAQEGMLTSIQRGGKSVRTENQLIRRESSNAF